MTKDAKKILIADESQNVRDLLKAELEVKGYQVITSNDANNTMSRVLSDRPDLIILDIMINDSDGSPICKRIKTDSDLKKIPIIILTAAEKKNEKQRRKECRADEYITKPFIGSELEKIIAKYLQPESLKEKKISIDEAMKKWKKGSKPYALCSFELSPDASTIFEQKYGGIRYSEMIEKVMQMITNFALEHDKEMILEQESEDRFRLLVGGEKEKMLPAAKELQSEINDALRGFYSDQDLQQGFVIRRNILTGSEQKIPLLSIKMDITFP